MGGGQGGLNLCRFYNIFEYFLQSTPKIQAESTSKTSFGILRWYEINVVNHFQGLPSYGERTFMSRTSVSLCLCIWSYSYRLKKVMWQFNCLVTVSVFSSLSPTFPYSYCMSTIPLAPATSCFTRNLLAGQLQFSLKLLINLPSRIILYLFPV